MTRWNDEDVDKFIDDNAELMKDLAEQEEKDKQNKMTNRWKEAAQQWANQVPQRHYSSLYEGEIEELALIPAFEAGAEHGYQAAMEENKRLRAALETIAELKYSTGGILARGLLDELDAALKEKKK